ncbi:hypothetical protein C8R47DRAFT_171856 [Mycena vitilis]|nr:hypothetical protein C8R47DRAFT_171856 [Mycena vitilis]
MLTLTLRPLLPPPPLAPPELPQTPLLGPPPELLLGPPPTPLLLEPLRPGLPPTRPPVTPAHPLPTPLPLPVRILPPWLPVRTPRPLLLSLVPLESTRPRLIRAPLVLTPAPLIRAPLLVHPATWLASLPASNRKRPQPRLERRLAAVRSSTASSKVDYIIHGTWIGHGPLLANPSLLLSAHM